MSNEIAERNMAELPAHIKAFFSGGFGAGADDLSANVSGGFGVISIRTGMFRLKYQGEEHVVRTDMNDEESDPVGSMEVVILRASPNLSKVYYAKDYSEGDDSAPDCFSLDGKRPDPSSPDIQCETCVACPHNKFGSKITPAGKKAKKCADSRRLAVAPAGDIANEMFGGPMLLRVPAASLPDLAQYGKAQRQNGRGYNTIVTRVRFDADASHPKLMFSAKRYLESSELLAVYEHIEGDTITRILEEAETAPAEAPVAAAAEVAEPVQAKGTPAQDLDDDMEGEAPQPAPVAAKPARKKAAAKKAASKPAPVTSDDGDDEGGLDSLLDDIDGLD